MSRKEADREGERETQRKRASERERAKEREREREQERERESKRERERAYLPPGAVEVCVEELNDVAGLDVERGSRCWTRHAKIVPGDQHLGQTYELSKKERES